ncbi:TetR/AcrR family transcriptional regulator [Brevibacillus sp. 179-C9.3 HS]|uniref:TetR/AcrR family transcriptional regulator n=1 Tax=unclassified Brevibacillus TaxID=2684853 RepID=UPI0039A2DAF4
MKRTSNRDHVIATASDLFLQKGLMNTSMDDVVAHSKVSKSNIYYHFKSKEELVVAVLSYRMHVLRVAMETILQRTDQPVTVRIELIFTTLAEELEGRSCVGGCPILSLLSAQIPEVKARINEFLIEWQTMAEKLLVEGIARGEFKETISIPQTAVLLVTIVEGAMLMAESHGNAQVLVSTGQTLLHLIQV